MQNMTIDFEGIARSEIVKKLDGMTDEIAEQIDKNTKVISIKRLDDSMVNMGLQHKQFETILKLINMGENLMIKGEAGNGKSHVVAEVAKALDLPFHSMSVSNQTTKTDLMGFVDAQGVYRYNGFISAFRDGGIFNMDEIDAGNANVLVVMNSALSNRFIETPSGEMIYAHKDFRFVSTANTIGRGATAKYVGRNKLDSATLDRFAVLNFELDEDIELMLCRGDKNFHHGIKAMRAYAADNYEDVMISQRSAVRLMNLLSEGFEMTEALDISVFKGVDEDIISALTKEFLAFCQGVKVTSAEPMTTEPDTYEEKMEESDSNEEELPPKEWVDTPTDEEDDSDFNW